MNQEEIYCLVVDTAEHKGSIDGQMLRNLKRQLEVQSPAELFNGLYRVFLSQEGDYFNRQQLAGKMLFKIRPRVYFDLVKVIKDSLDTYNLSVEEWPFYLRDLCGLGRVKGAISQIEVMPLTEKEKASLDTFKFWLGLRGNS